MKAQAKAEAARKTAIFARYSSKMQDETSLDAQVFEMERFAEKNGLDIVERYLLPETRSSVIENCPEWQRMMEDAKAKKWRVLLLHKLDRLGRDRETVVICKARLRRIGIEIRSVVENLSDSIEHRMLEGIFEIFADHYSRNLGAETRKGHRQLVRQGCWTGGKVPWGLALEVVTGGKKPHKRLREDPFRGHIMKAVFEKVAADVRTADVLQYVFDATGEKWNPASLYTRLRNPVYYGRIEYERTSLPAGRPRKVLPPEAMTVGGWAGLVSEETWLKVQDVLRVRGENSAKNRARKAIAPYLLSGLNRCSACGSPITGSRAGGRNGEYRYYYCSRKRLGCASSGPRTEVLDQAVLEAVAGFLSKLDLPKVFGNLLAAQAVPQMTEVQRRGAELRRELMDVVSREKRLLDALETGSLEAGDVGRRLCVLKERRLELAAQIEANDMAMNERAELDPTEVQRFLVQFPTLAPGHTKDLATLLRHLVKIKTNLETGEVVVDLAE